MSLEDWQDLLQRKKKTTLAPLTHTHTLSLTHCSLLGECLGSKGHDLRNVTSMTSWALVTPVQSSSCMALHGEPSVAACLCQFLTSLGLRPLTLGILRVLHMLSNPTALRRASSRSLFWSFWCALPALTEVSSCRLTYPAYSMNMHGLVPFAGRLEAKAKPIHFQRPPIFSLQWPTVGPTSVAKGVGISHESSCAHSLPPPCAQRRAHGNAKLEA